MKKSETKHHFSFPRIKKTFRDGLTTTFFFIQNRKKTMMNECAICVQPYNRLRKPVQCPHLSKSFLDGDYRKHQMASLLSEDMATIGELQVLVSIRHAMAEEHYTVA